MTPDCGAMKHLRIDGRGPEPQILVCRMAAGHSGPHRAIALDSDDNAITERWHSMPAHHEQRTP